MKVHTADSSLSVPQATQVFRMLADEPRLRILMLLAGQGELNVSTLCEAIGQSQPATSHHLTLLRLAGLVKFRRVGRQNLYYINSDLVRQVLDIVKA
jgi:ArsR family transcriptional regulator